MNIDSLKASLIPKINALNFLNLIVFILAVSISVLVNIYIYQRTYHNTLIILYLFSILGLVLSVAHVQRLSIPRISKKTFVTILFVLLLPVCIRIFNYNLDRIHGDDMLTAYFSATEQFSRINLFGGIPSDKMQWVCQFPAHFFFLQRFFFTIFGNSLLTAKLSVLPYVSVVSLFLFLSVRKLLDRKAAIAAVVFNAFFAPSLYLETLGLHFVSSTAIFMAFFYFAIVNKEKNDKFSAVILGLLTGLSYMFYSSSYIALPFMMLFFCMRFLQKGRKKVFASFIFATISFIVTVSPYAMYAVRYENYFTQRIDQVSLLTGTWSAQKKSLDAGVSAVNIVKSNTQLSLGSMYKDGLGGHGGYTYAKLALFEKFTLFMFLAGVPIAIVLMFKKMPFFWILTIIIASFISGIILTIPPPAYHRFSLAYPFIAIISVLPLWLIMSLRFKTVSVIITITVLFFITYQNQIYFLRSTAEEKIHDHIKLSNVIATRFPDRKITVAAFTGYAFEKIFYFAGNPKQQIETDYHVKYLGEFDANTPYLYVILNPYEFGSQFSVLDPNGTLEYFADDISLFYN